MLQFIQSDQTAQVRIAHIKRLGMIHREDQSCSSRFDLFEALVDVVACHQNKWLRSIHHFRDVRRT